MADISSFLKKILEAIYGEEVRGSIHDALAAMNKESSSAMEFAATAKDSAAASAEKAKTEAATATQKATSPLTQRNGPEPRRRTPRPRSRRLCNRPERRRSPRTPLLSARPKPRRQKSGLRRSAIRWRPWVPKPRQTPQRPPPRCPAS